ncbi:hypothetical protein TcasGA2_TC000342 [Tribolium castaneum]|uniref:Uncharacterized protein n=1 Tax=Tribolium castaneum TaxID=7070 RepID=D6WAT9_TRICA|nr:hypothetical protein TcasGA2_TC000342 [Tribolium castaneum]
MNKGQFTALSKQANKSIYVALTVAAVIVRYYNAVITFRSQKYPRNRRNCAYDRHISHTGQSGANYIREEENRL